jgi:c-di-GMP-related signal transduction protein
MTSIEVADPNRVDVAPDAGERAQINVCFSRQPILDREGMLCGFELMLHCVPAMPPAEGEAAAIHPSTSVSVSDDALTQAPTPEVAPVSFEASVVDALLQPAVRGALTGHPAYLDVSRALLFDAALERIPPGQFMFELPLEIEVDEALIERVIALHARRYRFVLDGVVVPNERFARLLPYVEGVKIDLAVISRALLPKLSSVLKSAGKLLIALGVDALADFETAHNLGFDKFQGYSFAQPHPPNLRRVSAPRHALLNLLQLLAGEPTVAQLEAELKLNPVLVMHLMKLANSSGLATGHKVSTLRDAINATGTNRIARWTQLLLYADGRKVALEDDPLLQLAASRARFMELAVLRLPEAGRDEADAAFLTGVFSFVDAVFGGSLESTLNILTLSKPIQAAILHREGVLGLLLAAVEALERGAWAQIETICERLAPLSVSDVAELGLVAAAWAGVADRSAEARGLERIED